MRRALFCTVAASSIGVGGLVAGCDETVSRQTETKVKDDGTVIKKEQKVTESSDGTVTKTTSTNVDKADRDKDGGEVKIKVDKD